MWDAERLYGDMVGWERLCHDHAGIILAVRGKHDVVDREEGHIGCLGRESGEDVGWASLTARHGDLD